jgi:hypothetical protein
MNDVVILSSDDDEDASRRTDAEKKATEKGQAPWEEADRWLEGNAPRDWGALNAHATTHNRLPPSTINSRCLISVFHM